MQSIQVPTENGPQVLVQNVSYAPFGPVQSWIYDNNLAYRRTLNKNYQPGVLEHALIRPKVSSRARPRAPNASDARLVVE